MRKPIMLERIIYIINMWRILMAERSEPSDDI